MGVTPQPHCECLPGWTGPYDDPYDASSACGSCYRVYIDVMNWTASEAACAGEGGNLASFTTWAEQNIIRAFKGNATLSRFGLGISTWIGLNRTLAGAWSWTDGSPMGWTNWGSGEPNNGGGNSGPAGQQVVSACPSLPHAPLFVVGSG